MKVQEKGVVYQTSRRAYVGNYMLVILFGTFALLLTQAFGLGFVLFPKTLGEMTSSFIILGLLLVVALLIDEPIIERLFRKYVLTNDEIVKTEGLFRKKKLTIPIQNIADVRTNRGIIGRILNYGDVEVHGFKDEFTMKGMSDPEEIQRMIQNKINMVRTPAMGAKRRRQEPG